MAYTQCEWAPKWWMKYIVPSMCVRVCALMGVGMWMCVLGKSYLKLIHNKLAGKAKAKCAKILIMCRIWLLFLADAS